MDEEEARGGCAGLDQRTGILDYERKRHLYFTNQYSVEVPPVQIYWWTTEDWVRFIDNYGYWYTSEVQDTTG